MKKRPLTLLWVVYAVLVFYGSLMPFDMISDAGLFRQNLQNAMQFWPFGPTFPGKADLVSNFILYVPLGLLVAAAGRVNHDDSRVLCIFSAVAIGAAVSLGVESLQAFSRTRVAGLHDFLVNVIGSLCGGVAGAAYGKQAFRFIVIKTRRYWRNNPTALVAGIMGFFLAADAFAPFLPTLKRSELGANLRNSIFSVYDGLAVHSTSYWIVKKIGVFAVLSMLLCKAFSKYGNKRFLYAIIAVAVFAGGCECGKLFISNRFFNAANVATAVTGGFIGAILASMFGKKVSMSGRFFLAAAGLAFYIIYIQLEGQGFDFNVGAVKKLPHGIEWLPMYDYAMSGRGGKVVLFVRTIGLTAALTFTLQLLLRGKGSYRPSIVKWAFGLAIFGAVLEGFQMFIPERYPTLTDVVCFALGGVTGSVLTMLAPRFDTRKTPDTTQSEKPDKPKSTGRDLNDKLLYLKYLNKNVPKD